MERTLLRIAPVALASALVAACAGAPETRAEQTDLEQRAQNTLDAMIAEDPTLPQVLDQAYGYAIFPTVTEGGAIVGGARGTGVVYEQGRPIGYATLTQADIGAQLGGQSYSELIVFQTQDALQRLKAGNFDLTAEVQATALRSGAARQAQFERGTAVFVSSEGGLMAGATVGGQDISFQPA